MKEKHILTTEWRGFNQEFTSSDVKSDDPNSEPWLESEMEVLKAFLESFTHIIIERR